MWAALHTAAAAAAGHIRVRENLAGSMCGVLLEVGEYDELSCRSIDQ